MSKNPDPHTKTVSTTENEQEKKPITMFKSVMLRNAGEAPIFDKIYRQTVEEGRREREERDQQKRAAAVDKAAQTPESRQQLQESRKAQELQQLQIEYGERTKVWQKLLKDRSYENSRIDVGERGPLSVEEKAQRAAEDTLRDEELKEQRKLKEQNQQKEPEKKEIAAEKISRPPRPPEGPTTPAPVLTTPPPRPTTPAPVLTTPPPRPTTPAPVSTTAAPGSKPQGQSIVNDKVTENAPKKPGASMRKNLLGTMGIAAVALVVGGGFPVGVALAGAVIAGGLVKTGYDSYKRSEAKKAQQAQQSVSVPNGLNNPAQEQTTAPAKERGLEQSLSSQPQATLTQPPKMTGGPANSPGPMPDNWRRQDRPQIIGSSHSAEERNVPPKPTVQQPKGTGAAGHSAVEKPPVPRKPSRLRREANQFVGVIGSSGTSTGGSNIVTSTSTPATSTEQQPKGTGSAGHSTGDKALASEPRRRISTNNFVDNMKASSGVNTPGSNKGPSSTPVTQKALTKNQGKGGSMGP